ncbi:unnamed protein product, partial [Mesorhabditis belari]|uniref:Solute carrier organic anion transporter family member n=1 Tax=Mesorhabditis belari TaxID=2138241 RepID=A0AAF3J5I7_9BILA
MYIISAVQNIERQFQITSKLSGILVSANDIGYIPTVIFISYFGSKGNRARWIGLGTVMMAITYWSIASPNFLFPVVVQQANTSDILAQLQPSAEALLPNASLATLLAYPLIKDRLPVDMIKNLMLVDANDTSISTMAPISKNMIIVSNMTKDSAYYTYSIEPKLMQTILTTGKAVLDKEESVDKLIDLLREFVQNQNNSTNLKDDLKKIRRSAIAPFAVCGNLINKLRLHLWDLRCMESSSSFEPYSIMFMSLFFLGVGRTMPWSLGIPLLDDNVKAKNSPLLFGGMSFIRILGPICGFLIGSVCNKFYYTLKPPFGLSPADPTWIGAWWIGFIFIGCITIIPSLMILFFPNPKLSNEDKETGKRELNFFDKHKNDDADKTNMEKFKTLSKESLLRKVIGQAEGFLKEYKEVLGTKIYRGAVVGRICDILAFKGYMTFLPKYLENHFGIPQYMVHRYMAMFGVFGFACGTMAGGLVVKKLKFSGQQAALWVLIMSSLNTGIFFSKSFIACESTVAKVGLARSANAYNFTQKCNANCGCEGAKLYPVCDIDGNAFYSPCHAGCREAKINKHNANDAEFTSCECAVDGLVSKNLCKDECKFATAIFFATVIIGAFIAGTGVVPSLLILLRSVPPSTRSISLGLQGFMVSLFGTLPSPFLWGVIIDSTCLVWEYACNGGHGACSLYNSTEMRTRMHFTYTGIRTIALFTDLYVYINSKDLKIMDDEEKESEVEEAVRRGSVRLRDFKEQ